MKTIEEVAAEVVERFRVQYENGPEFFSGIVDRAIQASIANEVEASASQLIRERYRPDIEGMMDRAIMHWMEAGHVEIKPPSSSLRKSIEHEISGTTKAEVAAATNRRMQHIYHSHKNGESFKSIADRLFVGAGTVAGIFHAAERRFADLQAEISKYQQGGD